MSKVKFVELFNNNVDKFVKELIKMYPDDMDFKVFKNNLNMLNMVDNTKLIYLFNIGLKNEYKEHIRNKDETFFLNNDYSDIKELSEENTDKVVDDNEFISIVNKLKDYWKNLDETNREVIWKYFETFVKIIDKYNSV